MNISPAVHIAYFGVYPDKTIDESMVESFLGQRASAHEKEVAMRGRLTPDELDRLMQGEGTESDMDALDMHEESHDEQRSISKSSYLRMRAAYKIAARDGWLRPIKGEVYLAPVVPLADPNFHDSLESSVMSCFFEAMQGNNAPSLTLHANTPEENPVVVMTMTRCVISGEVVPFGIGSSKAYFFKAAHPQYPEPELDRTWFDLTGIDTVAHCNADIKTRLSPLMGHGGFRPKPPGAAPV